jgi:DNA ligase-1
LKGKSVEEIQNEIERVKPVPGIPIYPRLVERVESFEDGFERMGGEAYVLQPKYDGLRCQIHIGVNYNSDEMKDRVWSNKLITIVGAEQEFDLFSTCETIVQESETVASNVNSKVVKLYSRNLENLTDMFPEIVEYAKSLDCETAILDSEVVGVDYEKKSFIPFQDTMTRRRKYDVGGKVTDLPVKSFVFDIIEMNSVDLTKEGLEVRAKYVKELLDNNQSETVDNDKSNSDLFENILKQSQEDFYNKQKLVVIAPFDYISTLDEQNSLFDKYVGMGFEGVVIKKIGAKYLPGVRNFEWIKLKKTMSVGNVDSFDLVILGYYLGSGKQTEYGMGALLAGVFNKETGMYDAVTKIGTGITQEQWVEIKTALDEITLREEELVNQSGVNMCKSVSFANFEVPDKWVYPKIVVQVDADEISRSQSYDAGKSVLGFGLALRFPRLIIFNRDKLPEDCTSVDELVEMYRMRKA